MGRPLNLWGSIAGRGAPRNPRVPPLPQPPLDRGFLKEVRTKCKNPREKSHCLAGLLTLCLYKKKRLTRAIQQPDMLMVIPRQTENRQTTAPLPGGPDVDGSGHRPPYSCLGNRCDFWGPRWASQSQKSQKSPRFRCAKLITGFLGSQNPSPDDDCPDPCRATLTANWGSPKPLH